MTRTHGSASAKRRVGGQRQRMLKGMVSAANRDGYAAANVASVIEQAGVSRPTFYEHFANREECFLAAGAEVRDRLLESVQKAVQSSPPAHAAARAIDALIAFSSSHPESARFLMSETLAGGPPTLDARDESVQAIASVLERAHGRLAAGATLVEIPSAILIGASYRLLSSRLRRGERALGELTAQLQSWMRRYEQPVSRHRREKIAASPVNAPPPLLGARLRAPAPLAPGRPRISEDAVAENHRLRIMFATAELVAEQGYTASTIAQITRRANVDGRVFYRMFADKQQAFSAIHELGFQQLMAATAAAFFTVEHWPQRMWQALRALSRWLEANPAIAHVGFVESYAVGASAVQRVEDSLIAFTIFLREGYEHRPLERPPTQLELEAIVTSVFETLYRQMRDCEKPRISATLPSLVHLSLAPFLGAAKTNRFIEQMLALGES
jgi:AcrR family transcriptional regulator